MCETPDDNGDTRETLSEERQRIRELNDNLRRTFMGGQVIMTAGFADLPSGIKAQAIAAIRSFDDFDRGSDPYLEHDFGNVEVGGHTVWFKIDYYDRSLKYGSPDAADPSVTTRVLTILLPEEY